MATVVRWSNTDGIVQCSMSRATTEATRPRYWATTHFVLPQWLPGQQANKQQSTNTPTKLAVLMAAVVRWYNTACIAWWRRSRASLEATGRCHWASIAVNNISGHGYDGFFKCFSLSTRWKRSQVESRAPVSNRGITYQTKEKGLTKVSI